MEYFYYAKHNFWKLYVFNRVVIFQQNLLLKAMKRILLDLLFVFYRLVEDLTEI